MEILIKNFEIILAVIDSLLLIFAIREIIQYNKTHKLLVENINVTKKGVDTMITSVDTIASSIQLLERDKIYFYLADTAKNAKQYIHHLSISQSSSEISDDEEKRRVDEFLDALDEAKKNGVADIKILGPDVSSKIGGLWERKKKGCNVKVSPIVTSYDFRIQVVDGKKVIIGIAPPETRSQRGFLIESLKLAEILDGNFMELWVTSKDLEENVKEVVLRHIKLYVHFSLLDEIIESLLNVPTEEMAFEVINMLIGTEDLERIGERVYRKSFLQEMMDNEYFTADSIKQAIQKKNIPIGGYESERIAADLELFRKQQTSRNKPASLES